MIRKVVLSLAVILSAASICTVNAEEASVNLAKTWWEEQTNVWTPIGWKSNYLKYSVLYNGALITYPSGGLMPPKPNARVFDGTDFMLTVHTREDGLPAPFPEHPVNVRSIDYGHGIQGWDNSHETPVIWNEFRLQSGIILREEIFAHQEGTADCQTGLEPLYAWVRLKVIFVDPMRRPDTYPVNVQLSRVYYRHDDECYNPRSSEPSFKIMLDPKMAPLKEELTARKYESNGLEGMYILTPDGKVRASVLPSDQGKLSFREVSDGVYSIKVLLECKEGEYVDLLVPVMPQDMESFRNEESLTHDGALTLSDWYWARRPETAATISVPEPYITEAIERNIKFAPVISEKDHVTGEYSYLTGVWGYDCLWSTPTSTVSHMMADQLGYHDLTTLYSEIFLKNQGTIKAPGKSYPLHPGYFGSPKTLTSFDWLTDHGAILLQLSTCCLLSHNPQITEHFLPAIIKACDFLKDMSAIEDHDGVKGLLPPAVSSDDCIETQAVSNIAWNYKGLVTAVRLLKSINHPRAAEFDSLACRTRDIFRREYRKFAENGPRWTDADGNSRYLPPSTMSEKPMPYHVFSEAFYLDTGPMELVWAGLMDADDQIMKDLVEYFRNGPNRRYYTPVYNCIWRPSLQHEISTCEPCYSWNIFHSWQLGDRERFLEGMYSLFVGALSQNTYRHGIQGNQFVAPLAIYLAKLSVMDAQIEDGALHLLRLCPKAWLTTDFQSSFMNVPTEYGPVNLQFKLSEDGKDLIVDFSADWKTGEPKVIVHPVPMDGITRIIVNGTEYSSDKEIRL